MALDLQHDYMTALLTTADWLLEVREATLNRRLPCHSVILCSVSQVLCGLHEGIKSDSEGKTVVPFPGSEKQARVLRAWVYNQQRPLATFASKDIVGLVTISHAWNITGMDVRASIILPCAIQIQRFAIDPAYVCNYDVI